MGIIRTTASLLAGIRTATDNTVQPALDTTVDLLPWLNEAVRDLWVICAHAKPLEYGAVSNSFSIASGNTFAIAQGGADGVAQTAFMDLVGVDRTADAGAHWTPIDRFVFSRRGQWWKPGWILRKRTLIIEPPEAATLYPLRYWYAEAPAALVNGGESIDLPFGGDQYVIQHCCALVRVRFEEDPTGHLALKNAAEQVVRRYLDSGPAEPIREASDEEVED